MLRKEELVHNCKESYGHITSGKTDEHLIKSSTEKAASAENVYGSPVYLNQALYSFNATATKTGVFPVAATSALLPWAAATHEGMELTLWGPFRVDWQLPVAELDRSCC